MSSLSAKVKVILKSYYKFNDDIRQKLRILFNQNIRPKKKYYFNDNLVNLNIIYCKIHSLKKPHIHNDVIQLFYNEPEKFFSNHEELLNATSYYDDSETSIFIHYFYVLHMMFKKEKKNEFKYDIYKSNFNSFFSFHGKYLSIQDLSLETPLHKIVKFKKKKFFLKIYQLLKKINVVNEKIISFKNVNDESCFDIIVKDIELNRIKIIQNKNYFELYNNFIKDNSSLINLLPEESQYNLKLFSSQIYFDKIFFKDIKFNELYDGLLNLWENVIEQVNKFFNSNINYFNCLFHLCKTNNDYQKLFQLISNISNKKVDEEINLFSIGNHISYVLRKMKMPDKTGEYGIKLINNILPNLLSKKSNEKLFEDLEIKAGHIKAKFNINSLVINLVKNSYITFSNKYEIMHLLEKQLKEKLDEENDEDVCYLYKLFHMYNKKLINKNSITTYFKRYEFIRKIFADYFFIGRLYRVIYNFCYKYDRGNAKNYIIKLSKFLKSKKNKEYYSHYKATYLMQDSEISIILKIIILFEEQNYYTGIEEEYLGRKIVKFKSRHNNIFEKLYKKFIYSEPKLVFYLFKDIIINSQRASKTVKKLLYNEFLELFFSLKYDFNKLLNTNKNLIPYFSQKNIDEFKIYEKKLKEYLPLIKGNQFEFTIYKFILANSPFVIIKKFRESRNIFIFENITNKFNILMKRYLFKLIFKWEEECDFLELSNLIKENILPFCKLFIDIRDTLENRKNKILFFFDEFIKELIPDFHENCLTYKKLALEYTNSYQYDDNFYYNLDSKIYISIMLIFIRLKFGKYNPLILYFYISHYSRNYEEFFLSFLKAYYNNRNKSDILYHYFLCGPKSFLIENKYNIPSFYSEKLFEFDIEFGKLYVLIYFLYALPKLKYINNSIIFDVIEDILKFKYNNESYNEQSINNRCYRRNYNLINNLVIFLLGINIEQNEEIFKLAFELIFNKEDNFSLYSFLDYNIDYENKEFINHQINNLKNLSLYLGNKFNHISDDYFIEHYLLKEKVDVNKNNKLIQFLKILHENNDSLFKCLNNNRFLLKISLHFLLRAYCFNLSKISKKNFQAISPETENVKIIKDEIYNFLDFYKAQTNSNDKGYIIDLIQIFSTLLLEESFIKISKKIYKFIKFYKRKLLYFHHSLDFSIFKLIINEDILMLILFFMIIFKFDIIELKKSKEDKKEKEEKKSLEEEKKGEEENSLEEGKKKEEEKEENELESKNSSANNSDDSNEKYYERTKFNININNKEEIDIFLNKYLNYFININLREKYIKYISIFNSNFESINLETEIYSFEELKYNLFKSDLPDDIYFVSFFIYFYQVYPGYNYSTLNFIYKNLGIKPKELFFTLLHCLDKEKKDIPIHFFLEKYDDKIFDSSENYSFLKKYFFFGSKSHIFINHFLNLRYLESSLIFNFIKNSIKINIEDENIEIELIKILFKLLFAGINIESNKEIFNSIIDLIFNLDEKIEKIRFYSFLDIEIKLDNNKYIENQINNIKQLALNEKNGMNLINNELFIEKYFLPEKVNSRTNDNLCNILKSLKSKKDSLLNCVKTNRFLLKLSLHFLFRNYFFLLVNGYNKKLKSFSIENDKSLIIKDEIYNFLNFYKVQTKSKKDYILDISQIFIALALDPNIKSISKIISETIESNKSKILYNYSHIENSFFKSIIEKDLLMFVYIFNYIINLEINDYDDSKKSENEKYKIKYNFIINKEEISIFLNEFLKPFININLKIHYKEYLQLFYNLETLNVEFISKSPEIKLSYEYTQETIYFYLVFIYIHTEYPLYDPSFLFLVYKKYYWKKSKEFFEAFIKCIKDKENNDNIPGHLFLDKDESINKKKIDITKFCFDKDIYISSYKKRYILKNLLNLNYSKNSFFYEYIDKKIEKAIKKNNMKKIDYILLYYSSENNKELYKKIIEKFIPLEISFYLFLEYEKGINTEENMPKIIKLIENLAKNTAQYSNTHDNGEMHEMHMNEEEQDEKKIEEELIKFYEELFKFKTIKYSHKTNFKLVKNRARRYIINKKIKKLQKPEYRYQNVVNKYINLLAFFKTLNQNHINLSNIINNNYIFLKETIEVCLNSIKFIYNSSYNYQIIQELKDKEKIETFNSQIYYCFISLFINNANKRILKKYFENNHNILDYLKVKIIFIRFIENYFIKKINKSNSDNIPDDEYRAYKEIIINFNGFNKSSFKKTAILLFEKDNNKFKDFINMKIFEHIYLSKLFILLIKKNLIKFLQYPELFSYISLNKSNSKEFYYLNNIIVKYLLNHVDIEQFSKIDIINNSLLFKDLNSALLCLNYIYNKNASIFVIQKIQNLFEEINTDIKLFLEIIKRQIYNMYAFEFLFKSFDENEIKNIFPESKELIIISLYQYSIINGYKYMQLVIKNFSKYISAEELKNLICPIPDKNENFPDYINKFFEYTKDIKEEKENKSNLKTNIYEFSKKYNINSTMNKYILFYALINKKIDNYETIFLLLEYCQQDMGIINFFAYLTEDFQNLGGLKMVNFIEYISKNNNKQKIKEFGNNLYKYIELIEKIYIFMKDSYEKMSEIDKKIFYYYIFIIILRVTPEELVRFLGIDNKRELNDDIISKKNKAISNIISEKELFIILSFYEMRKNPILPIKKYLPKFYNNIENMNNKYEQNLNLPKIPLTREFDKNFYEHYKGIIEQKTSEYINSVSYSNFKNYVLIIQNEYLPKSDLILDTYESIDYLIINLIEKDDIKPFYNNDEIDEFIKNINIIDYLTNYKKRNLKKNRYNKNKEELEKLTYNEEEIIHYKTIIYSLLDFNKTSTYILNNNSNLLKKYNLEDEIPLNIYIKYLEIIIEIYRSIINKNEEYLYNINFLDEYNNSKKLETKLKTMKNKINLNNISSELIKAYRDIDMDKNIKSPFFERIVKFINNFIISKNDIMNEYKNLSNGEINIISFFKFLSLNCSILLKFIEAFNQINEIIKLENIQYYILLKLNIEFIFNEDKNISRQNSGNSLLKLAQDFLNQLRANTSIKNFESTIKIHFYFNEDKECFCETCSNINLIEFIKTKYISINKCINEIINNKINSVNPKEEKYNELLIINDKLNEKDIFYIITNIFGYNLEIENEDKKEEIFELFTPLIKENQELISSYFKNSFEDYLQPEYFTLLFLIKSKINKIIFNSIGSSISLNKKINKILSDDKKAFLVSSVEKYNNYINLNEIIISIMSTKYHSNANLNSLFQIKAINYIINDNSDFNYFMIELYKALKDKKEKNKEIEKESLFGHFVIKLEQGKKYTKNDFNILQKKREDFIEKKLREKEIIKDKAYIPELKHGQKVQYKLCKFDSDIKYDNNYFPFESIYYINKKKHKPKGEKFFNNFYLQKKKHYFENISKFINVYDLIFNVKKIDKNNIIILYKNDINEILKPYNDQEVFNSLLNEDFSFKTSEEINIDMKPILSYLNNIN